MATAADDTYTVVSGATVYAGIAASLPTWRVGQNVNEWRELSGSAMSNFPPSVDVITAAAGGGTPLSAKMDNWSGGAIDTRSNEAWWLANGGHNDYWGNEVVRFNLGANVPGWTEVCPSDTLTAMGNPPGNVAYYPTGRPVSSHSYYQQHFIESQNRAVRVGTGAGASSGLSKPDFSAYSANATGTSGWAAQHTYDDLPISTNAMTAVKNPATEDLYLFVTNSSVRKWTRSGSTPGSGSWSSLTVSSFPVSFKESAADWDTTRNRIFLFGGAESAVSHTLTLSSGDTVGTIAAVTLTGAAAADLSSSDKGFGMFYVPAIDAFLLRKKAAGGTIYRIDASTFAVTLLATTGGDSIPIGATAGSGENVYRRILYSPSLGVAVYFPQYSADAWVLRIH